MRRTPLFASVLIAGQQISQTRWRPDADTEQKRKVEAIEHE
jgi:hypothetical protein